MKQISGWLGDTNINPEVSDHIGYVADGGPRFILSLNPPLPASNIAYFVVTLKPKSDIDAVLARTRSYFAQAHGDVRAEPKRFSLGATESGTAIYRVSGPDEEVLLGPRPKSKQRCASCPAPSTSRTIGIRALAASTYGSTRTARVGRA